MLRWLLNLRHQGGRAAPRPIPDALWQSTLHAFPFLARHGPGSLEMLRSLSARFLHEKEFHGAGGITITDAMAIAIAEHLAAHQYAGASSPRKYHFRFNEGAQA